MGRGTVRIDRIQKAAGTMNQAAPITLREQVADLLVVMPNVPAAVEGDKWFLDIKAVEGLELYARFWGGPVRCLTRRADRSAIPFGREYDPDDLGFEIIPILDDASDSAPWLNDASVVLASGDNHHDLAIGNLLSVPLVYSIEYTFSTRLRIIALEKGISIPALKSAIWTLNVERRRRAAFRAAAGLQANGQPAYDAYSTLSPHAMAYFDSRMTKARQISDTDLLAKQQAMNAETPLRIVFSGRLERLKGADHLVPVAKELRSLDVPFSLDIYGDGSLRAAMMAAVVAEGLGDVVRFAGAVPFDSELIPRLKQDADLFICCHRQADPSCTYLETLSCGVPIVGYGNEAFLGVAALGDAMVATPMNRPRAAAIAIERLHHDRPRLARMAAKAAAIGKAHAFEATFMARIEHLRHAAENSRLSLADRRAPNHNHSLLR